MDILVKGAEDGRSWPMSDLLGRPMGRIDKADARGFTIVPDGNGLETMAGMELGPHATLDAALAEIERHTRGICRREPSADGA